MSAFLPHIRQGLLTLVVSGLLAGCGQAEAPERGSAAAGLTTPVAELPLRRGFYVASDIACGDASNATLLLLRRDGIGGARDFCAFTAIERTGPTRFRVSESCGEFMPESEAAEPQVVTYDLIGDAAFTSLGEGGWQRSARYCEQSSLPPDWRDNDIGDLLQ